MTPQYQIFRTKKIKTGSQISMMSRHMMRSIKTPNADMGVKNKIIFGSPTPEKKIKQMVAGAEKRANSVQAIEVMVTTSPEWMKNATNKELHNWVKSSCVQLFKEFGKENCAHLQLHLDEKTPHITGAFVPIVNGRLNARQFLGGAKKLAGLQDRMAEAVAHLGLVRGKNGSVRTHQEVKEFYKSLDADLPEFEAPTLSNMLFGNSYFKDLNEHLKTVHYQAVHTKDQLDMAKSAAAQSRAAIASAEKAEAKADDKAQALAEAKAQLDSLRQIPLEDLVQELGLMKGKDKSWHDPEAQLKIDIKDNKFFDQKSQTGGKGAIDLTKQVLNCDFNQAKAWLMMRYGAEAYIKDRAEAARMDAHKAAVEEVKKVGEQVKAGKLATFIPPQRVDENWPHVRQYLTRVRKMSAKLVDTLAKRGSIYADGFKNAVFAGKGFAFKRGTTGQSFKGMHRGSIKGNAWRETIGKESEKFDCLVIAESAIDALSYMEFHNQRGTAAATFGVTTEIPSNIVGGPWKKILIAYDNDAAGKQAAAKLHRTLLERGFTNVGVKPPPAPFKDWNEALIAHKSKDKTEPKNMPSPQPKM
jgi:hypothetical protein